MPGKWIGRIALVALVGLVAPLPVRAAEAEGESGAEEPKTALTPDERAAQAYLKRYREEMGIYQQMRQREAAQNVKVGKAHFQMGDYANALKYFKKAVELAPRNREAATYLKMTRSVLELPRGGPRPEDYMAQQAIALQMHHRELVNDMARAKALYRKGRYDAAIAAFTRAEAKANWLSRFAGTAAFAEEAALYIRKATAAKAAATRAKEEARRDAARERSETLRQRRSALVQARLRARMDQARSLFEQGRYEDARIVCEHILRDDPSHGAAQSLLDAAVSAARERDIDTAVQSRTLETDRHWRQTRAWSAPQYELVAMSRETFDEVRRRRPATAFGGEVKEPAEWERRIEEAMGKKISFDFVETPLQDVISFLSSLTNVTIVLDQEAIRDQAPAVTLKVTDMRLESALNWVLKLVGLKYTLKDEAIFISKPGEIFDEPERRIYDVSDLTIDIKNFKGRQQALATDTGHGGEGEGGNDMVEDFFDDDDDDDEEEVITGQSLIELIKRTIAPGTWEAMEEAEIQGWSGF
jgi:tetratricopeptide (TPR) repeat protein